jgi:hydrogenase maturation factor
MTELPSCGCITCSDQAIEMTVIELDAERELAVCETAGGERETVEIALVGPVGPAERVLVHAGTAIARAGGAL